MSVHITYFVHGTTTDNQRGISSGWKDAALSDLGKSQAAELGRLTAGKRFDIVFCSDLTRAVDTATIAWGDACPIVPDSRWRECNYGTLNGAPSDVVEPMQEQSIGRPFPNGESYEDVRTRVADFLSFLKQTCGGKQIAIVAHKAPQLALDVLLGGKTWERAMAEDWRKSKAWQPGWKYELV